MRSLPPIPFFPIPPPLAHSTAFPLDFPCALSGNDFELRLCRISWPRPAPAERLARGHVVAMVPLLDDTARGLLLFVKSLQTTPATSIMWDPRLVWAGEEQVSGGEKGKGGEPWNLVPGVCLES